MTEVPPLRIASTDGADDLLGDDVDGDDRLVGADAARELLRELVGLRGAGDAVGGAQVLGGLALVGQRIDRDHVRGTGVRGTLYRVRADAADAVDDHGLAGPHVSGVDGRAPAGRHAAADEHHRLQRKVLVDRHAGRLGDRRVLAEAAEHAHGADVGAVVVEAEGAVGQATVEDRRAQVADARVSGGAEAAVAADRQEGGDDVVALLHAADPRPAFLDDAGALMAADHREAGQEIAVAKVLVGMAEPGRDPADQHLTLLGLIELELGDLPRRAGLPHQSCPGLHEALLLQRLRSAMLLAPRFPRRCTP